MSTCASTAPATMWHPEVHCHREEGHRGDHQAWCTNTVEGQSYRRLQNWDAIGDTTSTPEELTRDFTPCTRCLTVCEMARDGLCHHCAYWEDRLETYADGRSFVADGIMYSFGGVGCFGGMVFTVTFTDGRVVDPARPWHNGPVPEEYRERWPDNATISNGRKDPDPRARFF